MKRTLRLIVLRACGGLLRRVVPSCTRLPAGTAQRILVLRPDHLGDVLLSRPAIEHLARALPAAQITVGVGPWGRAALGTAEGLRLLICPFPGFQRSPIGSLRAYLLLVRYAVLLRRIDRFTMAVILRPDHWWGAFLACLAGIPVRVGYVTPETAPFLTVARQQAGDGRGHAAAEALRLVESAVDCVIEERMATGAGVVGQRSGARAALALPVSATPADRQATERILAAAGLPAARRLLILHPGAGSALKSWPVERFAAVGAHLATALEARVIITGATGERGMVQAICDRVPGALNLAGRLSWGELEALIGRAALVVGVDSGPLHLAVAAGTPSVALFGPADPAQFGPWSPASRHRVVHAQATPPCRPCRRLDRCRIAPDGTGPPPCMRAIEVPAVIGAALAALGDGRGAVAPADQA